MQAPVRIFLSHAKADLDKQHHDDPVRQVRNLLNELPVEQWFDAQQIATGQDFADAISAGIRDSSIMLAFQTDHYSTIARVRGAGARCWRPSASGRTC